MDKPISIILMDPFVIVADGAYSLLKKNITNFEVVKNLMQLKTRVSELEPLQHRRTSVIMELFSEEDSLIDSIKFAESFVNDFKNIKLTIYTGIKNFAFISRIMEIKPHALVSKYDQPLHLQEALISKNTYISPTFLSFKTDPLRYSALKLSDTEWKILSYLDEKYSINTIADLTQKSISTIKLHRRRIMEKLQYSANDNPYKEEQHSYTHN